MPMEAQNVDSSSITALSLFAGYGGLDTGVSRAFARMGFGWRVAAYVEREAYAVDRLCEHVEAGRIAAAPIWTDVTTFDGRDLAGKVDCITAGFPCQDLSVAGKRAGIDGERSGLWSHVARLAGEIRPRWLCLENVAGLLDNRAMRRVLGDLSALGFDARWISVRASDVGAPQRRERVFILAHARRKRNERRERSGFVRSATPAGAGDEAERQRHGDSARDGCQAVAHADDAGPQGRRDEPGKRAGERASRAPGARYADLPAFPPGPGDRDGWRWVLERWPELAPAIDFGAPKSPIRGVVDGAAALVARAGRWRAEALRLGGNGVVPLQAEAAFTMMIEELCDAG